DSLCTPSLRSLWRALPPPPHQLPQSVINTTPHHRGLLLKVTHTHTYKRHTHTTHSSHTHTHAQTVTHTHTHTHTHNSLLTHTHTRTNSHTHTHTPHTTGLCILQTTATIHLPSHLTLTRSARSEERRI